jgi:Uma2 family endonuclease
MATTPALLTIEEYLKTSYRPDCDFVDGEIEERNVGERDHNRTQLLIGAWFLNHESAGQIEVIPEQRTRVSDSRVRIPDICLIRASAPREQVTATPPLLCIEVLSPEDRFARITKRLDDFARMGVPHLWIIDPRERVAYIYDSPGNLKLITDRLGIPESPIYLDLPTLFAALD